jgi:hypothetical protein
MSFPSLLVGYLISNHRGERNAITAGELRNWGTARQIRKAVHEARVLGLPICSTGKGYFYPENANEKRVCKKRLMNMIKGISKAAKAVKYTDPRQQVLF